MTANRLTGHMGRHQRFSSRPGRSGAAGFTLVELLVAVVVGLALTLAVTMMLVRQESGRRTLTSINDTSGSSAYLAFLLDRTLRSAGSGYAQAWYAGVGCRILAARAGVQVLPRPSALPAPFDSVPQTLRLAPVVVHAGVGSGGSDVIAVFSGSSGLGEAPLRVLPGSATGTGLRVPATVGLKEKDLVLISEGGATCMLQQLADGFAGGSDQQMNFGSTYAANDIAGVNLSSLGTSETAWVTPMGNAVGAQPTFALIGVGANQTLVSLDLLNLGGSETVLPIADGVADLRVLYGIDTNGDDRIDDWVSPAAAGWTAAALLDGSVAAQARLAQIQMLRVGLLLRTSVPERDPVAPASMGMFADMPSALRYTRTLSEPERLMRWRNLEFTVPLRNVTMAP